MPQPTYFEVKRFADSDVVLFQGIPAPYCVSPVYNVLQQIGMTAEMYADKANALFGEHRIRVPEGYPAKASLTMEALGGDVPAPPWKQFAECVGSCILIEEEHGINVTRIVRDELILKNSREGILHASSLAALVLHYLRNGSAVEIVNERTEARTPDLVIDGIGCELKVVDESDWTRGLDPDTGKTPRKLLSEDLCYDIGTFLRSRAYKGIVQADLVFADLSLKSFGYLRENGWISTHSPGMPTLKKNRLICFSREIIHFEGFSIDFDPVLWDRIKNDKTKHGFGIAPWREPPSE